MNDAQTRFVQHYLVTGNATKAAELAGYSPKTAPSQGSRLLKNANVKAALSAARKRRSRRTKVTADRVVDELAAIGFADIGDVLDVDEVTSQVKIRPLGKMPAEVRRTISEIKETTQTFPDGSEKSTLTIKQHSKMAALAKLFDHLGMEAPKQIEGKLAVEAMETVRAMLGRMQKLMPPKLYAQLLEDMAAE